MVGPNSNAFEYSGYHFTPVRQFHKSEGDFHDITRRAYSDHTLGLSTYDWQKAQYSYEGFYAAATDKNCDLFRCEETGRLYYPGQNELFGYNDPPQRSRAAKKFVVGALEQAKAEQAVSTSGQKPPGHDRKGGER